MSIVLDGTNGITSSGSLSFGANAGTVGINFNNNTSGVGTEALLNDYETGTYTVTMTPSTSGSITLNFNQAAYTKIGRLVTVQAQLQVGSISSPVGTSVNINLPFVISSSLSAIANRFGNIMVTSNNGNFRFSGVESTSYITCTIDASTIVAGSGGSGNWYFSFSYIATF